MDNAPAGVYLGLPRAGTLYASQRNPQNEAKLECRWNDDSIREPDPIPQRSVNTWASPLSLCSPIAQKSFAPLSPLFFFRESPLSPLPLTLPTTYTTLYYNLSIIPATSHNSCFIRWKLSNVLTQSFFILLQISLTCAFCTHVILFPNNFPPWFRPSFTQVSAGGGISF